VPVLNAAYAAKYKRVPLFQSCGFSFAGSKPDPPKGVWQLLPVNSNIATPTTTLTREKSKRICW